MLQFSLKMKENGSYLSSNSAILHSDQRNKNGVSTITSSVRHTSDKIAKTVDYGLQQLGKNNNLVKEDSVESILLKTANSQKAFDQAGSIEGNYQKQIDLKASILSLASVGSQDSLGSNDVDYKI
jgi:hypothetical protein